MDTQNEITMNTISTIVNEWMSQAKEFGCVAIEPTYRLHYSRYGTEVAQGLKANGFYINSNGKFIMHNEIAKTLTQKAISLYNPTVEMVTESDDEFEQLVDRLFFVTESR